MFQGHRQGLAGADGRGAQGVDRAAVGVAIGPRRHRELGPWLDQVAARGVVVVQFWLKPGETAATLGIGEKVREREKDTVAEWRNFNS